MREIYLDNSATTKVHREVAELMTKLMCEDYGNPSSMHIKGVDSEKYIRDAKEYLAKALKVNAKEIFFTSCGTESDNLALIGVARANARRGKHLITTKIEHPAILNAMKQLEEEGFSVTYLGTDASGIISLDELKNAITDETILVSVMHVNNEIGSVQPIAKIGELIKSINPNIYFHVDDVQGFSKLKLYPKKMNIDMLSVSAHKIHGPKGMGLLYINEKVKIVPIIYGGGQQNGMRSGTENVAGIAAMSLATKMAYDNYDNDVIKLYDLKRHFIKEVTKIPNVTVNGLPKGGEAVCNMAKVESGASIEELSDILASPHVISVSVEDVRAEVLLHSLEDKGIYVSAGSACSTHKRAASATLMAINLDKKLLESTVRFSLSTYTTEEDINEAVEVMKEIVPSLRRFVRK